MKMLILKQVDPLPEVCQKCDQQYIIYAAADDAEKLRMEIEEDFFFDCGCCEHGAERFYLAREDEE